MHHPFSKGDPGRNKAKHQTPFWDKVSLSFDMIKVPFSFQCFFFNHISTNKISVDFSGSRHIIVIGSWEVDITRCRWIVVVQSNDLWKFPGIDSPTSWSVESKNRGGSFCKYQVTNLVIMILID